MFQKLRVFTRPKVCINLRVITHRKFIRENTRKIIIRIFGILTRKNSEFTRKNSKFFRFLLNFKKY